jgi:hypothetical protein
VIRLIFKEFLEQINSICVFAADNKAAKEEDFEEVFN